ncbi:hypothetical protein G6F24_014648 [Rhizopus arrhizus]|nr:hypothetical protein G6F24_014648 [Rhizopus arrhizus]
MAVEAKSTPDLGGGSRDCCERIALGRSASASALASTEQHRAGTTICAVIKTWPEVGPEFKFTGCASSGSHDLTIRLEGQGLKPVSTVVYDGLTYVTYETSSTSPLYFFHVRSVNAGGVSFSLKDGELQEFRNVGTANGGQLMAQPHVGVVARPGMTNVAATPLGKYVLEHPRLCLRAESTLSASVAMRVESCSLNDVPVQLPEVQTADLSAAGSHARDTDFNQRGLAAGAWGRQHREGRQH